VRERKRESDRVREIVCARNSARRSVCERERVYERERVQEGESVQRRKRVREGEGRVDERGERIR
jgi:hypothetical protein